MSDGLREALAYQMRMMHARGMKVPMVHFSVGDAPLTQSVIGQIEVMAEIDPAAPVVEGELIE